MKNKELASLWQLIVINYKEFIREPGILFWSLAFPVLMAWVLGVAFTKRDNLVQTIACVCSHDPDSKLNTFLHDTPDIIHSQSEIKGLGFRKTFDTPVGKSTYLFIPVSADSAILMLKRGITALIILDRHDSLVYQFDPQNTDAKYTYTLLSSRIGYPPIPAGKESVQILTEQGTRYVDFLIPGLLALGVMNGFLWGIGYGLIEIRTKKLLRRMVAAPMKKSAFIFSHFFARISLSTFEAAVLLFFAWLYFRIRIQGSIPVMLLVFVAGSFCFAGISILMASRTSSSRVGNALINIISLPMMILSGIFFSYHNFPDAVIPVIRKLPLTLLADSMRSIMIEGTGFRENLPAVFLLSGMGVLCFAAGIRIYKWY